MLLLLLLLSTAVGINNNNNKQTSQRGRCIGSGAAMHAGCLGPSPPPLSFCCRKKYCKGFAFN
jgi:hypothetical protein